MDKAVRFLLVSLLREKIGGGAEVCSTAIGRELKIEISGVELEHSKLKGWLKHIFRCFTTRDLPYGFFASNEDRSELLAISIRANKELIGYKIPVSSWVEIQTFR